MIDVATDQLCYWLAGFLSGTVRARTRLEVVDVDGTGLQFQVRAPDGTAVTVTVEPAGP